MARKKKTCSVCNQVKDWAYHYRTTGTTLCEGCHGTPEGMDRKRKDQEVYEGLKNDHKKRVEERCSKEVQELKKHGVKIGDRVQYFAHSFFGLGGEVHYGTVVKYKGRVSIRLDKKAATACGYRRYVNYQSGWEKVSQ